MSRKPCNTNTHRKQPPSTPSTIIAKPSATQKRCAAIFKFNGEVLDSKLATRAYRKAKDAHRRKDDAWRTAVAALPKQPLPADDRSAISQEMKLSHLHATKALHPELRRAWRERTMLAVAALVGTPSDQGEVYFWHLTITNKAWHTTPDNHTFNIHNAKQWLRNALLINAGNEHSGTPVNYIGVFEFEMLNLNAKGKGRERCDHLHPHAHVLVWSTDREGMEAKFIALKKSGRIKLRCPDGKKVHCKDVHWKRLPGCADVVRVAAYMFKSPVGAKRRLQCKVSGRLTLVNDKLTRIGRSQLTLILNDYALSTLIFASGEGVKARSGAVSALAAERKAERLEEEAKRRRAITKSKRRKTGKRKRRTAKRR
jgi:hypothetical protein